MRDILLVTVVFGLLPWALKFPHIGLYLYSWLGYMNPHRLAWGFAASIPFAYITAIVTVIGIFTSKEPKKMPWTREMTVLALFVFWMMITTLFAFYPALAGLQLERSLKIQLMIFLTPLLINTRERLHILIWVIVLSLGYYGFKGGIFTILHGGAYHVQGPEGTFIEGNNELALALLMTIPLMRYLHLTETRKWIRRGLLSAMILTGLAAIGSQSRGALVGALTMGLVLWLKGRNKMATGAMLIVVAALVAVIMPASWYERMSTIQNYQQDGSALARINAWHTAWNIAVDRPLIGGGFDPMQRETYQIYAPDPSIAFDVHNIYLKVLAEHGFVGLGLFLLLALLAWRSASWIIKNTKRSPDAKWAYDFASMAQVSMVGYGTAGMFLGLSYFDLYYHLVMMIVITKLIVMRDHAARVSARPRQGQQPPAAV